MGSRGTPAKITVRAHPIAQLNAAEDAEQKKTQPRPRSAHRQKTSNAFDVSDSSPTAQVTSFFCRILLIAPVESQVTRALSMSSPSENADYVVWHTVGDVGHQRAVVPRLRRVVPQGALACC